jgi:uncharacterized protein YbbC (DUF1343 family)
MRFICGYKNTVFLWLFILLSCGFGSSPKQDKAAPAGTDTGQADSLLPAANNTDAYVPQLRGKKVGVVANQTSVVYKLAPAGEEGANGFTHLIDSLVSLGIDIDRVFAPEHGFRGVADAGEHIKDGRDPATGLPVLSLYGAQRKPGKELLKDLDLVLFDIQDLGVRFYTYIATLQLVMEACAENNIPVMVLDRPNPNAHYVDGPVMEDAHRGFLGLTPIPLVYGMTIGEYAGMINGEGWMEGGLTAKLTVIKLENYTHESSYSLPIRPSPNIPNDQAVRLYPSLGLFEGTNVNAGRGTEFQFQRYGAPFLDSLYYDFSYIPEPNFGAGNPKHNGERCFGRDLSETDAPDGVSMRWILDAYQHATDKTNFFNTAGFTKHAGTENLQRQIEAGWSEAQIKASWEEALLEFRKIRARYLLYP